MHGPKPSPAATTLLGTLHLVVKQNQRRVAGRDAVILGLLRGLARISGKPQRCNMFFSAIL
jgi:hypothetical protein